MNKKSPGAGGDQKLRLGTWLSLGSPVVSELAAELGFDWLLFDLEHGCGTEAALLPQLHAVSAFDVVSIVRVGAPHPELIARVLDWGADGLMIPRVSTSQEAEACVQAAYYPPRGRRGFSRTVRTYGYGLHPPADGQPLPTPLLMAQIETIEAVRNALSIARVDGIDVLFVGPADLQLDLKQRAASAPGDYAKCLGMILAAAKEAGKESGILVRDPADVPPHRDLGFTHIAVESDISVLRKVWQQAISSIQTRP